VIDQTFGEYTVLRQSDATGIRHKKYLCKCSCGNLRDVFAFSLRNGSSWHCGCKDTEVRRKIWDSKSQDQKDAWRKMCNNTRHSMHATKVYRAWVDMRQRCGNPLSKWYATYGGRGITVCEDWQNSFDAFFRDMGNPPTQRHQLGRINNDDGYSKANCRWETPKQNQRNKSNSRFIETPLGLMNLSEASERFGLSACCIRHRISAGWELGKIFSIPSTHKNSRNNFHHSSKENK
jgi:hypothetical protein